MKRAGGAELAEDQVVGGAGAEPDRRDGAVGSVATEAERDSRREEVLVAYGRRLGRSPALSDIDDAALEDAVRVGAAELAAATCRWLELLGELVIRGIWAEQHAATPSAWLSWALGIAPSTAREHVRVALRLRECPLVRERFATGTLSYSKVRAITRVCEPALEPWLLSLADAAPAATLERIVADTRRVRRLEESPADRDDLGCTTRWRDDGTFELTLRCDAPTGIAVEQHLDRLLEIDDEPAPGSPPATTPTPSPPTERTPRRTRRADAVVASLAAAVANGPADAAGTARHLVVVHAEAVDVLASADDAWPDGPASAARPARGTETDGGGVRSGRDPAGTVGDDPELGDQLGASAESSAAPGTSGRDVVAVRSRSGMRLMARRALWQLACTSRLQLAVDTDGHPADLGRASRDPDARIRRLLWARDRGCAVPDCGTTRGVHAHHVRWWSRGGRTDLANLVLLCSFHHHRVHDAGFEVRPDGTGGFTFHDRAGSPERERSGVLPGASARALRTSVAAHLGPQAARGLQPDHFDGGWYDHDLTISLLAERLAVHR